MTTPGAATNLGSVAGHAPDSFLRIALKLDAVVTGLNGVVYLAAASVLDGVFDLSANLLRGVGVFLFLFGVVAWFVGTRPVVKTAAVRVVIAVNIVWVIESLVVAATGLGDPSTVARVWIVLQAIVVGAFALLQVAGLRRRNS